MPEPCVSAAKISAIDERTKSHDRSIFGFQEALTETNKVLGKISEALADIRHLREDQQRNERDIDEIYGRMRTVELAPGKALGKFALIVLTAGSGCAGGVISGATVWMLTHG